MATMQTKEYRISTIERRPDGDLTIKGTDVWLPSDPTALKSEIEWTTARLHQLIAAECFLSVESEKAA